MKHILEVAQLGLLGVLPRPLPNWIIRTAEQSDDILIKSSRIISLMGEEKARKKIEQIKELAYQQTGSNYLFIKTELEKEIQKHLLLNL